MWPQIAFCFILIATLPGSSIQNDCAPENIPKYDPDLCCNLQGILDKAIAEECKLKYADTMRHAAKQEHQVPSGCCFSECVLNATGILKQGAIDSAYSINYWKQKIPDPKMTQVITNGVSSCLQEMSSRKADFELIANLPPSPNAQRICNPLSGNFLGCIHSFIFRNCPETRWVHKDECQKLKDYFNRCPLPFPILSD